jgi:hypothetical protein
MLDPLGPDPTATSKPASQVAEIGSDVEIQTPPHPPGPRIRYANYDDPAASARTDLDAQPAVAPKPVSPLRPMPVPKPAATALARPQPSKPTAFERALSVAKTVLPYVGKMLPLLEGNVVSAATNLLAKRPMQEVDLKPLEDSIARIQADQRALTFHTTEQKRAIQRLEDEFAAVQEAVQKNAADHAELIDHVTKLAKRTSSFMRLVIILLVISILFTTLLVVRIAYILRP